MKRFFYFPLSLVTLTVASLVGCSKEECIEPQGEGLAGTWKLVERQCYCPRMATPNETAVFTASDFSFYANGQLASSGTYTFVNATICGLPSSSPGLRLTRASANNGLSDIQYTLNGNTLILDYGSPCDAPRDTYERVR